MPKTLIAHRLSSAPSPDVALHLLYQTKTWTGESWTVVLLTEKDIPEESHTFLTEEKVLPGFHAVLRNIYKGLSWKRSIDFLDDIGNQHLWEW